MLKLSVYTTKKYVVSTFDECRDLELTMEKTVKIAIVGAGLGGAAAAADRVRQLPPRRRLRHLHDEPARDQHRAGYEERHPRKATERCEALGWTHDVVVVPRRPLDPVRGEQGERRCVCLQGST